jgi:hypothetical protein
MSETTYGVTVPTTGWGSVADFEAKTKVPLRLIRCYPAGKLLEPSLSQCWRAVTEYPNAAIVFNPLLAGRGLTVDQVEAFAKQIGAVAHRTPRFIVCPDAEPDRKDRSYRDSEFVWWFTVLANALKRRAPHVELSLNLTGYDFANRIRRYDPVKGLYSILSLDPYWTAKPNAVQGTTTDLRTAVEWCKGHGKRLALAEWGAEGGDPILLADALSWIRRNDVDFSAYYHESNAPIPGALTTPEAFAVYRAGASVRDA